MLIVRALPMESFRIVEPIVLGLHHLFEDVAGTTVTTGEIGDIESRLARFVAGIKGGAGESDVAHALKIGYVVAHIDHLFRPQTLLLPSKNIHH